MKKTITKEQIIHEISSDTGYSKSQINRILESLFMNVGFELSNNRRVQFNGFGTFGMKYRAARTGRNPHTKEAVPIPARIIPVFEPGENLKRLCVRETK